MSNSCCLPGIAGGTLICVRILLAIAAAIIFSDAARAQEYEYTPAHDLVSPEQMRERLGSMEGRVAAHCVAAERPLMVCMVENMAAMQMVISTQKDQKRAGDITYRLRFYDCLPADPSSLLDLEAVAACYLMTEAMLPE